VDVEPATVSRIETGARPARTVLLLRLASAFQVSVGDLLGDMPTDRVDPDEAQLVEAFRMLDPSLREAVLRIVASLVSPAAAGPPPTLAAPPEPPPEPK
jgi:transcriptional regulator with XRE-family HTH domain